jgi:carboxypeptidase Taq
MQVADKKRGDRTHSLYTQMLDEFEMGMSQQRIDDIFGTIQEALVPLIAKVLASETQPSTLPLKGHFEIAAQKEFCQDIVTKLGYNLDQGRIDVSVHPFTMSFSTNDVRITSRFKTDEWYQGLAATIHEGGWTCHVRTIGRHSLTNLDAALSMGTHESQSLFWERHVGLSMEFWEWATPMLQQTFPEQFHTTSARDVYGAVNAVSPSLIRVEADELTYPLHVILRYNIERPSLEEN